MNIITGAIEWTLALVAVLAVWLVLGWAGVLATPDDGTSVYDPASSQQSALCGGAMGC